MNTSSPYPKGVGSVPDSPREAILRTLCNVAPPSFETLAELAHDRRSDVNNAAIEGMVRLVTGSTDDRSRLVEGVLAKRFVPKQCEVLLGERIPYAAEALDRLCDLQLDPEPSYRSLVVRFVLRHPAMGREQAYAIANTMKGDHDANIRDDVHRFLDGKAPSVGFRLRINPDERP